MVKKKNLICLLLVFTIVLFQPNLKDVEAVNEQNGAQNYYDLPLCLPGYYATQPGDCLPLGPSQTISALREQGFPYPLTSLPAAIPDPSLVQIPIRVARIGSNETLVFASLEEAIGGSGTVIRTIPGGANNRYVAMIEQATSGNRCRSVRYPWKRG